MQANIDSEFQRIVESIKSKLLAEIHPEAILLFGSGARGELREDSDIDLLVVWDERPDISNIKRQILLRKLIGAVDRPVDILTCSTKELNDSLCKAHPFTKEILKEGVVLYGRLH
jgi:predicted nucleotidyltransferase